MIFIEGWLLSLQGALFEPLLMGLVHMHKEKVYLKANKETLKKIYG